MATLGDIGLAAAINIISALIFFLAFAILRLQPFNDRVYFPKWYLKGLRSSPTRSGAFVRKFVNLDLRSYLGFLNWMPAALNMPEPELIDHAGLDSAVYLRIYLLGYEFTNIVLLFSPFFPLVLVLSCFSVFKPPFCAFGFWIFLVEMLRTFKIPHLSFRYVYYACFFSFSPSCISPINVNAPFCCQKNGIRFSGLTSSSHKIMTLFILFLWMEIEQEGWI